LGNLRNTSRRYGRDGWFGDYTITTYNFGDGNFIREEKYINGLSPDPETRTYRVNGDTVIFLSSGRYWSGTIVGTALRIGDAIYR